MKRRTPVPRVERRRALIDLNLVGNSGQRAGRPRAGCASLLARLLGGAVILAAVWLGLG